MSTQADFEAAIAKVNGRATPPSTDAMLKLYGLYKQATAGDATGKRPGMLDVKGRAKFDAWEARRGMSKDQARDEYIRFSQTL